jgi:hypothetical protein
MHSNDEEISLATKGEQLFIDAAMHRVDILRSVFPDEKQGTLEDITARLIEIGVEDAELKSYLIINYLITEKSIELVDPQPVGSTICPVYCRTKLDRFDISFG